MTVLGANNGERLPAIDSQPAFENALRRALEMDEPLQGVLCNNLTVTGENLCRLEALQICLERCRFENCDFSKTSFYDARLVACDFSKCAFSDSYWKRCQWIGCRLNGANFAGASLHDVQARDTRLRYANFARALMEDVKLTDCDCADAGFAEVKLRRVIWQRVSLRQADFFRTSLKGMDLSACDIAGMQLSENAAELRGVRVSAEQAMDIARRLGVIIV